MLSTNSTYLWFVLGKTVTSKLKKIKNNMRYGMKKEFHTCRTNLAMSNLEPIVHIHIYLEDGRDEFWTSMDDVLSGHLRHFEVYVPLKKNRM